MGTWWTIVASSLSPMWWRKSPFWQHIKSNLFLDENVHRAMSCPASAHRIRWFSYTFILDLPFICERFLLQRSNWKIDSKNRLSNPSTLFTFLFSQILSFFSPDFHADENESSNCDGDVCVSAFNRLSTSQHMPLYFWLVSMHRKWFNNINQIRKILTYKCFVIRCVFILKQNIWNRNWNRMLDKSV